MEARANYALIGVFVLAALAAGFTFVFWMHRAGGLGERAVYRIQFDSATVGMRPGTAVHFNGLRIGEVTALRLAPDDARRVIATIAVDRNAPLRSDVKVGMEQQGLMGAPVIALSGGDPSATALKATPGEAPLIVADPGAGHDTMQAAREVLRRLDQVLVENSEPLRSTIANLNTFSAALARNSERLDTIADGLANMLGGQDKKPSVVFDLTAAREFPKLASVPKMAEKQLAVADPTTVLALDSQRIMTRTANGEGQPLVDALWTDNLPRLLQARLIQSFENAKFMSIAKDSAAFTADNQLMIDIRTFDVELSPKPQARVELGVKLTVDGRVVGARLFDARVPSTTTDGRAVSRALDEAFGKIASEIVTWTFEAL